MVPAHLPAWGTADPVAIQFDLRVFDLSVGLTEVFPLSRQRGEAGHSGEKERRGRPAVSMSGQKVLPSRMCGPRHSCVVAVILCFVVVYVLHRGATIAVSADQLVPTSIALRLIAAHLQDAGVYQEQAQRRQHGAQAAQEEV